MAEPLRFQPSKKDHTLKKLKNSVDKANRPKRSHLQKASSPLAHNIMVQSGTLRGHDKKQSALSQRDCFKISNKVVTTDESNNGYDSKMNESIFVSQKRTLNQEYFHEPLTFKHKKKKVGLRHRDMTKNCLNDITKKLDQVAQMVQSQEKEMKRMSSSMSDRQVHRLLKIHSTEQLRMMKELTMIKSSVRLPKRSSKISIF